MKEAFKFTGKIHFRESDPAGILFFGNSFALAHDAYESLVAHLGFSHQFWFKNPSWIVPIRKSACDYFGPLPAGSEYSIDVTVEKIGSSSLNLLYTFTCLGKTACEVRLVHVFADKNEFKPIDIPSEIRQRLEAYQAQSLAT